MIGRVQYYLARKSPWKAIAWVAVGVACCIFFGGELYSLLAANGIARWLAAAASIVVGLGVLVLTAWLGSDMVTKLELDSERLRVSKPFSRSRVHSLRDHRFTIIHSDVENPHEVLLHAEGPRGQSRYVLKFGQPTNAEFVDRLVASRSVVDDHSGLRRS